jgi:outer membrane protein TolC
MHRLERRLPAACLCLLAGICAASPPDLAPERWDRPWIPATDADGAIVPGERAAVPADSPGYVLPANEALRNVPPPPDDLDYTHAYTLPELIDIAESSNPATRIAWDAARDAALAAGITRSTWLPRVSASIVGGYQSARANDTVLGVDERRDETADGSISAISVQWLLFDFGQRSALIDTAEQNAMITNIAFTAAHQQVIYEVSLAFYANAAARTRVENAGRALDNAGDVQKAAEERYDRGIGTVVEVAQARQVTAQHRLAKVRADGQAQDAYLALIAATGMSPLTRIEVADLSRRELSGGLSAPVEHFVSDALAVRPDMLAANAAHEASLAALRAAEAEFLPKLFVGATGAYLTGDLEVTAIPAIGSSLPTVNLNGHELEGTVLIGITVPLYDGGRRRDMLSQARAKVDQTEAALAQVRNAAIREVVAAGNAVKTSLATCDASTALVEAAQTTFDAALAAYRNGVGSITAVTEAETQLLEAKNAATDAYSLALASAATLALSAGTLGVAPQ